MKRWEGQRRREVRIGQRVNNKTMHKKTEQTFEFEGGTSKRRSASWSNMT